MILDLAKSVPDPAFAADVCIVGAGAAGVVLAHELSGRGKSVVLLEAGGAALEEASQDPMRSEITGLHHRGIHEGRFRAFGGTTTQWGGQVLELDEEDFTQRPWVPGSGWPFSKKVLKDYYKRAACFEGVDRAYTADADVWRTLGIKQPTFHGLNSYLTRWCPEPNFARLYGEDLAERENVWTWLHANAVGLILTGERVDGVRVRATTSKEFTFRASDYVFCLGTIESVRFFLQPRDGGLPWNRSCLLGCYFQDHIDCNAGAVVPHSGREVHTAFDSIFLKGYKYQPKVKLPFEVQRTAQTLNAAATLAFEAKSSEDLASIRSTAKHFLGGRLREVTGADLVRVATNLPSFFQQGCRYVLQHRSWQPRSATISLRVHCEQEPCSRSTISLAEERDAFGMYRARLHWRISPIELHTIRTFISMAKQALSPIAEVLPVSGLNDDGELRSRCEDSFHHMGGMRMDDCSSRGVVSTKLKLHGTRNAWVCSGAVFPTSGFSNPTHTLLALTLRLADELCR